MIATAFSTITVPYTHSLCSFAVCFWGVFFCCAHQILSLLQTGARSVRFRLRLCTSFHARMHVHACVCSYILSHALVYIMLVSHCGPVFGQLDVNMLDEEGYPPLTYCVVSDSVSCIDALVTEPSIDLAGYDELNDTTLHHGVTHGAAAAVHRLLELGLSPNVTNQDGNTPLHTAILNNKVWPC